MQLNFFYITLKIDKSNMKKVYSFQKQIKFGMQKIYFIKKQIFQE